MAFARLMELFNKVKARKPESIDQDERLLVYLYLTQALYPFTPHLASDINNSLSEAGFEQIPDYKSLLKKI